MIDFNLNSLDHLSCFLFGGILKEEVIEPILDIDGSFLYFKSGHKKGQLKTHVVEKERKIRGLLEGQGKKYSSPLKKQGFWSTDEKVLNKISNLAKEKEVVEFCKLFLEIRGLEKKISTYYNATEELIYDIDSCVHPQFNTTATDTGRLSCKGPNVQNQPNDEVLKHFRSRFK